MSEVLPTHSTPTLRQNSTTSSNKVLDNIRQSLDRSDDIIKQFKLTHEDAQHLLMYTKHLHTTLQSIEQETRKHTSLLTSNELEKMTKEHEQMNNDIAEMKIKINHSEEDRTEFEQSNVQVNTAQEKKEYETIEKSNENVDNHKLDNNQPVNSEATPLKNVKKTKNYLKVDSVDIPKHTFVESVKHAPFESPNPNDNQDEVDHHSDAWKHDSMSNKADVDSNNADVDSKETVPKHINSNVTHTDSERLHNKSIPEQLSSVDDLSESLSETFSDSSSSDTLENIESTENTTSSNTQTNTPTTLRKHKMRGSSNLNTQTFIKNDKTGLTLVSLPVHVKNERTRKMKFVRKQKSGNTVPVALKHGLLSDLVRHDRLAKLPLKK